MSLKMIVGRKDSFTKDLWYFHEFIATLNFPDNNTIVILDVTSFTSLHINLHLIYLKKGKV